ncbi:toll/interleukin-1 receptor domain-containing protein [Enterococcus faecium]|nr:toll/interleukin-1 receptor domain-containing protein [Enterococcus faecium]
MDLNKFRNKDFYNILVSFDDEAWESDKYEMDRSRFLEYTNNDIKDRYNLLDNTALEELLSFPCLFLYELGRKNYGYIGYITNVKIRDKKIGVKFEKVDSIPTDDIIKLAFELDIDMGHKSLTELHRTHWAIKRVNLFNELQEYRNNLQPDFFKPKIFISYSWDSTETQNKVYDLVEQLEEDGVEVIYDKKVLRFGDDMVFFMESIANDPTIKKVLVICDESYTQKANSRKKGVGIEAGIITSDIYNSPLQNKIIPVFFEKDKNNQPIIPTFLKNRFGVDLCSGNKEKNYPILRDDILS